MESPTFTRQFSNKKSMVDILNSLQEEGTIEKIKKLDFYGYHNIPVIFGLERLKSLETLDCWKCQTYEILNLDRVLNLKEIRASANNISDISYFNNCKNLEKLNLNGNKKLEIVHGLFNCDSLKFLDLSFCNISFLKIYCVNLEVLLLVNNNLTTINNIDYLKNLKILNLRNSFNLRIIDINIDSLEELYLDNCNLQIIDIKSKKLKRICFEHCLFNENCKINIPECLMLNFDFSNINSQLFQQIKYNDKLQLINFVFVEKNDIQLREILNKFPNLLTIEIYKTEFSDYKFEIKETIEEDEENGDMLIISEIFSLTRNDPSENFEEYYCKK